MTTREMKALRRGAIVIGVLLILAGLLNTYCDQARNLLSVSHGR
jgi:hypothetical protein